MNNTTLFCLRNQWRSITKVTQCNWILPRWKLILRLRWWQRGALPNMLESSSEGRQNCVRWCNVSRLLLRCVIIESAQNLRLICSRKAIWWVMTGTAIIRLYVESSTNKRKQLYENTERSYQHPQGASAKTFSLLLFFFFLLFSLVFFIWRQPTIYSIRILPALFAHVKSRNILILPCLCT